MILREFYIDGFGLHHDLRREVVPGLNVVVGPNEAGKTTLHDFFRCMLFGFPPRGADRFHPLRGGALGGWVEAEGPQGPVRIERKGAGKKDLRVILPGGAAGGQADLEELVRRMDGQVFRNVFAFSLDELAGFSGLGGAEMELRLFDSSLSGAGRSATALQEQLDEIRERELKPKSGNIRDLAKEIARLEAELKEAKARSRGHGTIVEEEERLERELRSAAEGREAAARRAGRYADLLALWEEELRRREAEEALRRLPPPPDAPQAPDLLSRFDTAEDGLARLRVEDEARTREAASLAAERSRLERNPRLEAIARDPEVAALRRDEGAQRERRERLRELEAAIAGGSASLEAARADPSRIDGSALAELKAARSEREHAVRRLEALRDQRRIALESGPEPTSLVRPAAAAALVFLVAAGVALALGEPAGGAVSFVAAVILTALAAASRARGARARPEPQDEGVIAEAERAVLRLDEAIGRHAAQAGIEGEPTAGAIEAAADQLQQARARRERAAGIAEALGRDVAERDRLREAIADYVRRAEALTSAAGIPGGEEALPRLWEALEDDRKKAERARLLEEKERALRDDEERAGGDRARLEAIRRSVLDQAGVGDRNGLAQAIAVEAERDALQRTLREARRAIDVRLGVGEAADEARRELSTGDVPAWTGTRDEARALEKELLERIAAMNQQLALQRKARQELEESADVPRLSAELASTRALLAEATRRWRRATLLERLLHASLETMRRERQPAVLRHAGEAFARITGGRYEKIEQTLDGNGIEVIAAGSGVRVPATALSRGTREQLYVCVRLGLAAAFADSGTRLPLLMDDVFVNFDPSRADATAAVVADFAKDHQVLLFTCHPHTVERIRAAAPSAGLLELAG